MADHPTPEQLAFVRAEASRRHRRLSDTEQHRAVLAQIIDVGRMSDQAIDALWLAWEAGRSDVGAPATRPQGGAR